MVQRYILFFNSKQNRIFFLKKYQKKLKAFSLLHPTFKVTRIPRMLMNRYSASNIIDPSLDTYH